MICRRHETCYDHRLLTNQTAVHAVLSVIVYSERLSQVQRTVIFSLFPVSFEARFCAGSGAAH